MNNCRALRVLNRGEVRAHGMLRSKASSLKSTGPGPPNVITSWKLSRLLDTASRNPTPMSADSLLSNHQYPLHHSLLKHSLGALYSHESPGSCPSGTSAPYYLSMRTPIAATRHSAYCLCSLCPHGIEVLLFHGSSDSISTNYFLRSCDPLIERNVAEPLLTTYVNPRRIDASSSGSIS